MNAIHLKVNGHVEQVHADGTTTLLEVLRDQLFLTGAKRGCDYGSCGTCTVQVDGVPARSCLVLAADLENHAIATVEGLAQDGRLSRMQQALVDSGAIQCGYCIPGIVMTLESLLAAGTPVDEATVRQALVGHLCRCTGYEAIVDAAVKAAHA